MKRAGTVTAASRVYETKGWQTDSENWFLNQVLAVDTVLSPRDLMTELLAIESQLGRRRTAHRNQDRVIDIDILFYGQLVSSEKHLEIPHPRLHLRRFVLVPLAELAPGLVHPVLGRTVAELLNSCGDRLEVRPAAVEQ
jgi:2-amino-4-hydroxy-6-hydroxymethyldihydropteridine diphosphokinase